MNCSAFCVVVFSISASDGQVHKGGVWRYTRCCKGEWLENQDDTIYMRCLSLGSVCLGDAVYV